MGTKYGEVFRTGMQTFDFRQEAAVNGTEEEEISVARIGFSVSYPDFQGNVWRWVWINRKMVIVKVWFWEWKLGQIRGEVFEKAFGKCPFDWRTGPE